MEEKLRFEGPCNHPSQANSEIEPDRYSASLTAIDQNSPRPSFPDNESTHNSSGSSRASSDSSVRSAHRKQWDDNTVPGWPQLAVLMAKTPDFAAFPRFRDLNIKSLLYYQVQLEQLRKELQEQESKDAASDPDDEPGPELYAERAVDMVSDEDSTQFKIIEKMREVLKKYNEALLQYHQISALPEPDPYNMLNLRRWMRHPEGGNYRIRGEGDELAWGKYTNNAEDNALPVRTQLWIVLKRLIWLKPPAEDDLDLIVTRPQKQVDGLTKWAVWYLIPFYESVRENRRLKREEKKTRNRKKDVERHANEEDLNLGDKVKKGETVETWSETTVVRMTSGVATVVACLLPVVAITVLSQLHGTRDLLFCIAGFAIVFAVGLIFLTQGMSTRVEIFTATAAFSAVLVVFISTPVIQLVPGTLPLEMNSSTAGLL